MKKIAIITARGGSKRIPKKNIKEFCGKPIIAYSIEAALNSGIFDEVMVSTDSQDIVDIALEYGAKVPFLRSEATSNDYATTKDVLIEVLEEYGKRGEYFDIVCCIYPTAPFVTREKLKKAVKMLADSDADQVMPVVKYSLPPQWAMVIREGKLEYKYPEYLSSRSQDLEPIYCDCGQFYVHRTDVYMGKREGTGKIIPIVMPEEEIQDIDNMSDWVMAELKYQKFIQKI